MPVLIAIFSERFNDKTESDIKRNQSMSAESDNVPIQATKPAPTSRKSKAVLPPPIVPVEKKPFRMSYDGTTTTEHIQYMIDHGAR